MKLSTPASEEMPISGASSPCTLVTSDEPENLMIVDTKMEAIVNRFQKVAVEEPESLTSRRGTVVGVAGGVAARRSQFIKQASAATIVKSLAEELEEVCPAVPFIHVICTLYVSPLFLAV